MAVSTLLDKCAVGNSLQEIKPASGQTSLFAAGLGRGGRRQVAALQSQTASLRLISHNDLNQAEHTLPLVLLSSQLVSILFLL